MRIVVLTTDNREAHKDYENPHPHFGPAPEALLQGFALLPEIEFHVVSCIRRPVVAPEKIAPNIFYHRVVVPKLGWMRTLYLGCILPVRKKIQEIKPDIVHGQGTERDCSISAVWCGFPNVMTIHGNMKAIAEVYRAPIGSFHWIATRLENVALHRTAGVFCNSAYTEKMVAPRTRRTWRVWNPLRLDFFSPIPEKLPAALPAILNVGVAEPRKQQVELLAVARRLHERGFKFQLQFAGNLTRSSAYGIAFADELARAEKAGYARHLGNLTTAQLVAAMDAAAGLVHYPSEEAFGLVVAEAMARNLKFFGAATGGVVDIASGVEGAELFPVDDSSALENGIARWLQAGCPQPKLAAELMRQRYHPEVIARRHLEIYREVLGSKIKN